MENVFSLDMIHLLLMICNDFWQAESCFMYFVTAFQSLFFFFPFPRWFDKSFSLIFTADGQLALNFEHAWGDGVAVMSYFNEIVKDLADRPYIHPDSKPAPIDASQYVKRLGKESMCSDCWSLYHSVRLALV